MEPEPTEDILGPKKRNYQFLQLVRDKRYPQALILGKIILKDAPDNPSVRKFVQFIEHNAKKLDDMAKQEQQYESAHSSDDSDEEQQEGQEEVQEKQQSDKQSKSDEEEQEEEEQKPQVKIQLTTCTLNQIPHVCPRHHKLIIEAAKEGKV